MQLGENFLLQAIRNESLSRDVYERLAKKIEGAGQPVLERMSKEEDTHQLILSERYRQIFHKEPIVSSIGSVTKLDAETETGTGTETETETDADLTASTDLSGAALPDFTFIEKSVFTFTDAIEALRLCLGAEIDAVYLYSKQMETARTKSDMRMLKSLVRFEKRHKKHLERLIKQTERQE
jgi:rubrerythrin